MGAGMPCGEHKSQDYMFEICPNQSGRHAVHYIMCYQTSLANKDNKMCTRRTNVTNECHKVSRELPARDPTEPQEITHSGHQCHSSKTMTQQM